MTPNSLPALEWTRANLPIWDEWAAIHARDEAGLYAVDRFRAGEDVLLAIERAEIGDIVGKRLAHLQCHIGIDTLCLARRGAIVSGLDFSSAAIGAARALAAETGTPAAFVTADVYDAPSALNGPFDVVYVTWGSLNWLPDMGRWANVVARLLAPGGFLYLAEQHPFISVMRQVDGRLTPTFAWRTLPQRPVLTEVKEAFAEDGPAPGHGSFIEWLHPLSDIIGGLLANGLRLEFFHEHETLPWRRFPMMESAGDRLFRLPARLPPAPLAFSLRASKPGAEQAGSVR